MRPSRGDPDGVCADGGTGMSCVGASSFPPCREVVSTPTGGRASLLSTCVEMGRGTQGTRSHGRGRSCGAPAALVAVRRRRAAPPAGSFRDSQTLLEPFSVFLEKAGGGGDAELSDGVLEGGQDTRVSHGALQEAGAGEDSVRPPESSRLQPRLSCADSDAPAAPSLLPSAPMSVISREERDKPASCVSVQKPARSFPVLRTETRHRFRPRSSVGGGAVGQHGPTAQGRAALLARPQRVQEPQPHTRASTVRRRPARRHSWETEFRVQRTRSPGSGAKPSVSCRPWPVRVPHSLCAEGGVRSGVQKVLMVAGPSPPAVNTCTSSRYSVDGLRLGTART